MLFTEKCYFCTLQQHSNTMKAIQINFSPTEEDLTGKSKWWGAADMPESMDYPMIPYEDGDDDPMTFVCQIRCADLAPYDPDNLLPHKGMLYFFAAVNGFFEDSRDFRVALNDDEAYDDDEYYEATPGLGEWSDEDFRVLYSPTEDDLVTNDILDENGSPDYPPAEKMSFGLSEPNSMGFRLLGHPYFEEIEQWYPEHINLLQIDENEDWGLRLYDCGMINFLIKPEDLKARRFDRVLLYFHSL